MIEDVKYPGHRTEWRADAKQQGNQAQVTDGRVGEQPFDIMFKDGDIGTENQGNQPGAANDKKP